MFDKKTTISEVKSILGITNLEKRMELLEHLKQRVKQLECAHNFVFDHYEEGVVYRDRYTIILTCDSCNKKMKKYWGCLSKKEQQAYKLLKFVPEHWDVKTKENK